MADTDYTGEGPPAPDADQRAQLAKLIAYLVERQNTGKYSPENLWALQGRQQLPSGPDPRLIDRSHLDKANVDMPIARALVDPGLDFPTAKAGPESPDRALRTLNQMDRKRPFPGAKEITVEPPKTYSLPKSAKTDG